MVPLLRIELRIIGFRVQCFNQLSYSGDTETLSDHNQIMSTERLNNRQTSTTITTKFGRDLIGLSTGSAPWLCFYC